MTGKQNRSCLGMGICGGGRAKEKIERRGIWWMYFVFMYENRTVNTVEIVLRREGMRENGEGESS
jgi:hypothetical protein